MSFSVCLVEPDEASAQALTRLLAQEGYRVTRDRTLGRFLDRLTRKKTDVVIMDLHLPGMEGREIIRALRSDPAHGRLIITGFSDRHIPGEAAAVFCAGADEYFLKPFDPQLLLVRLKSLLRSRDDDRAAPCFKHGELLVDPESRVCRVAGKAVELTRLEFDLLLRFVSNPNRVLTRGNLLDTLWGGGERQSARAVDRHVYSLRGKLGACGRRLKTMVGIGYCFQDGRGGVLGGSSK